MDGVVGRAKTGTMNLFVAITMLAPICSSLPALRLEESSSFIYCGKLGGRYQKTLNAIQRDTRLAFINTRGLLQRLVLYLRYLLICVQCRNAIY